MGQSDGLRRRRPAHFDLAPSQRHDGSLDGYRRQRRAFMQRRLAQDVMAPLRYTGRTQ